MTTATAAPVPVGAVPIACSATGGKFLMPPMTPQQVCDRFARAYRSLAAKSAKAAPAPPKLADLSVEIRFLPQGVAQVSATHRRQGRVHALPLYELAVSDRKFLSSDIDRLAADVVRGVRAGPDSGVARSKGK